MPEENLKEKAVNGTIWRILEMSINQATTFVIGVVLARLLSPEDYGVMGMLTVFFATANCFKDCGIGAALVQKKTPTEDDYSTAFLFNVAIALAIYIVLFISAPLIANFYNLPILTDITRVSALSFIISSLSATHFSRLNIELRFKFRSQMSILAQLSTGLAGIVLALMGYGVWALVLQGLISGIIVGIVLWFCSDWKPKLKFSTKSFRRLWHFGSNMLGSNIINTIYGNLYTLFIGKFYSSTSVGMYNRANGYASLPSAIIMDMSIGLNFPILAKLQDDNVRLIAAYEKLLRIPFYVLYPILIGLVTLAEPLIQIMIGDKWLPCVPFLQILCVGYMFYPLNGFNSNILLVKGRSDLVLKLDLIKKPIGIALLVAALPFGIIWMMVGKALYSVVVYSLNCYYTKKILDYGLISQLKVLFPIIIHSLLMGAAITVSTHFLPSNVLKLSVGIPVGVLSYLGIGYIKHDETLFEIVDIVKSKTIHK